MIVSTSKTIDEYLDSLPSIENKEEEQLSRIAQLEEENKRYEEDILSLVAVAGSSCALSAVDPVVNPQIPKLTLLISLLRI